MSDDRQTPADEALAAVMADPVLAGLYWTQGGTTTILSDIDLVPLGIACVRHGSGDLCSYFLAGCWYHTGDSIHGAVAALSSRVSTLLAACRAADPEVARLREEVDRVRDAADILARQLDAARELREQAEEHYRRDSAASAHRREEDREALEAARAEVARLTAALAKYILGALA